MEDLINDEILERLHEEVVAEWMEILSEGAKIIGKPVKQDDVFKHCVEAVLSKNAFKNGKFTERL